MKPELSEADRAILDRLRIENLVVDQRISKGVPLYGYYFESWEQMVWPTPLLVDLAVLNKFDAIKGVDRVYDNGNIRVYDVQGLYQNAK